MSRVRVLLIAGACVVALVAAGVGLRQLHVRNVKHAKVSAVKAYVAKVGPPTRSLYKSWTAYERSIGPTSSGPDENAVRQSRETALQLQQILGSLTPPPTARVFQDEMSDVVKNILTVVEDRLALVLSTPSPDDRRRIQTEAGNAFYVVKQTFADAITQLTMLERIG